MDIDNYIEILSKSSSGNPYTVRFYMEENGISAFCSCPAGENRKLCKHIIRIINSDDSILFDNNQKNLLGKINSHLQNTDIPRLVSSLRENEILLEKTQENVKKAKKALEKVILKK
jgi:uncharacterized Zn finger protein